MNFLIGFNMVTTVLWYFYIANLLSEKKIKGDLIVAILTTLFFEGLTLLLTTGIWFIINAF